MAMTPALDDEFEDEAVDDAVDDGASFENEPEITIEQRARAMGWKPLAEYRGDPRRWSDAETFVQHGEQELPILRDQSRRLAEKVARSENETAALRSTIAEQGKAIKDAMELARRSDERGYNRGIAELKAKQRAAVATGDMDEFDQVQAQIDAAQHERETTPAPTAPPEAPLAPVIATETTDFIRDNPWFKADPELNRAMVSAHQAVMNLRPHLSLADQYEAAREQVVEAFPHKFPETEMARTPPPVETPPGRVRPRATVLTPSAPVAPTRRGSPFDRIENEADRAEAKSAFANIQRYDPDATADEYVKLYFKEDNILDLRAKRKK